jgi:hypothetical protein
MLPFGRRVVDTPTAPDGSVTLPIVELTHALAENSELGVMKIV